MFIGLNASPNLAEAAGRICEALRAAGVEVWFDGVNCAGETLGTRRSRS